MTSFYAVSASSSIGPVYSKQEREQYAPELGETCSLTDRVFQDKTSQQKLDFKKHPWHPVDVRLTDYVHPDLLSVSSIPDHRIMVREYRKMIREHVERRVLFFFQQMIVSYQTKLHFESAGAQDQGKSAEAINLNLQEHPFKYVSRQAAHSSGNPCLLAYDDVQWQMFEIGESSKPEAFVFLKNTDYYRLVNATMNMPKCINDADREIDEKTEMSLLRAKGQALINRGSQGDITPDEGMIEYIQEALNEVKAARKRLLDQHKDPEVQEVLAYYEKYLTKFQGFIGTDPAFLEKMLGFKMGALGHDEKSKRILLQIRYAAIRNCQLNQSVLIQKVENVKQRILAEVKASNGNKKPDHFDAAFRTLMVEHARTGEDRARVEKLLNFSPFNFEAQIKGGAKGKYIKTKASLSTYSASIDILVRDILEDMRRLRAHEVRERSQIVKELRAMKHWSQSGLGQQVKSAFPHAVSSQSTIFRIENRVKPVTESMATEFSQVFKVDSVLFMPHFYYD